MSEVKKLIVTYTLNDLPTETVEIEVDFAKAKTFEQFQELILKELEKRLGAVEGKVVVGAVKEVKP